MMLAAQQVSDAWTEDDANGFLSTLTAREQTGVDVLMDTAIGALSGILGTAAADSGETKKNVTTGDFVMIQGFILQLFAPLMALGMYYMQLRQAIVDVESLMELLETEPDVVDVSCGLFFVFSCPAGGIPAPRSSSIP